MKIQYTSPADEDRQYWQLHDRKIAERIETLIADILEHPFSGLGKPTKKGWSVKRIITKKIKSKVEKSALPTRFVFIVSFMG
jgi:toxin YoeB